MLVTLKPREERTQNATEIIAELQRELSRVPGITLYLQPVQDLTIEDRVSRTQFQFILEDPDSTRLSEWVPKLIDRLKKEPALADVASDLQDRGLQAFLAIDRDAASRLGVSVSAIDDALYDAFGQRLISTIYTQANQYRVVLEAAPRYQIGPEALEQIHVTATNAARRWRGGRRRGWRWRQRGGGRRGQHVAGAAVGRGARRGAPHAAGDQSRGAVPRRDALVQSRPGRVARRRGRPRSKPRSARSACPPASRRASRARRKRSARRSTARCC